MHLHVRRRCRFLIPFRNVAPSEPSFSLGNKDPYFKWMAAAGVETGVRDRNPEMLMLAELGRNGSTEGPALSAQGIHY